MTVNMRAASFNLDLIFMEEVETLRNSKTATKGKYAPKDREFLRC